MRDIKVYFMGSGDIAVPVLAALDAAGEIDLVGICTQPDKPAGRRKIPTPTPVGRWCDERGFAPDKPESVDSPEFLAKLADLAPDFVFVVSFGQILRQPLLDLPGIACVNLHASLLPRHRGASPIAAAILAGDAETGVTFMKMDAGLDTGPEYAKFACPITNERADELEMILGEIGAERVVGVLAGIAAGELRPTPQDDAKATVAGKIRKTDALIDWRKPAADIARRIRAYHPWPGAYFFVKTPKREIKITITRAEPADPPFEGAPGDYLRADENAWLIACGQGALSITTLKPEGKKEMTAAEFLRGRPELRGNR